MWNNGSAEIKKFENVYSWKPFHSKPLKYHAILKYLFITI